MKTFKHLMMAAVVAVMFAAAPVKAADLNIAVVDVQSLMTESKAAKSIESQIATMRKSFQGEVEAEEKTLREKEKSILDQKDKLKPEELQTKAQEFQKLVAAGQKKVQDRKATLDKSINDARNKLKAEIVKIVSSIGESKDLDMVISKSEAVVVNKDLDLTAAVMSKLDEDLPSVKVQ